MYPSSKMQDEGIFFMRKKRFRYDFLSGSIVWRKHVPEKRKKKKKKNSLRCFSLRRYDVTGFTNNPAKSPRCLRGYMDSQARVHFAQINLNSCLSL